MHRTHSAPTIHDVAVASGVSVATVSRVLNAKGDVSKATAARVRAVIDSLGYESSIAARGMRNGSTQVIGMLVPDLDHSCGVEMIKAASRVILGTPYELIIMTSGKRIHEERVRWEQQQVRRINGTITDGVIVVVPDAQQYSTSFPIVALDPYLQTNTYPSVIGDNVSGAQSVMDYLLGMGHTRIGFVGGHEYLQSAVDRRNAYVDALLHAGLSVDPVLVRPGDFTRRAGASALHQFLALPDPPTAIFACNDDTALGILESAQNLGIDVPGTLSVVGFDNVPEAAIARPPLTTIDQGIDQMVCAAFQMLLTLIEGKELAQDQVKLATSLVVRVLCPAKNRATASAFHTHDGVAGESTTVRR